VRFRYMLVVLLVLGVASACRPRATTVAVPETDTPFVSPLSSSAQQSPLGRPTYQEQDYSALASFSIAQERAQQWNANSVWHGIVPVAMMEKNLGIPATGRGWFFRFGQQGNTLELYVLVDNLGIRGATEAQPILVEPLPYELLAIELKDIQVDSPQVLEAYKENGGQAYLDEHPEAQLDFRLMHVKGKPNPVWSLFDAQDLKTPLFNVDAKTGEVVGDPFASSQ
jgi:hypothetical protein